MPDDPKDGHVECGSLLSARTKQGMVELVVNDEKIQIDIAKAKEIRDMLSEAIEAAITDEIVFRFLTTKVGLPEAAAARALVDLRELRQGSKGTVFPQ